jgi:hypothetical protein
MTALMGCFPGAWLPEFPERQLASASVLIYVLERIPPFLRAPTVAVKA